SHFLALYGRFLKLDIARFYSSIYTHSIPWAILGKPFCKKNLHQKVFKDSYPNRLDKLIRACQDGQSIGIPLGPDTSTVLAEVVASAIDTEFKSGKLKYFARRAFRYTDDIIIGLEQRENPEEVISEVARALAIYNLELSESKTQLVCAGDRYAADWV